MQHEDGAFFGLLEIVSAATALTSLDICVSKGDSEDQELLPPALGKSPPHLCDLKLRHDSRGVVHGCLAYLGAHLTRLEFDMYMVRQVSPFVEFASMRCMRLLFGHVLAWHTGRS